MKNILFFNASAGSGKTHTIAGEIIKRILGKSLRPESIIATTFTNDAAEELKKRLRKDLIKHGCYSEAVSIDNAMIGTVNSIGGRLLERYSYYAGLPPKLIVLDETGSATILNKLIARHITPEFLGFAERLGQDEDHGYTRQIFNIITLARINNITSVSLIDSGQAACDENLVLFGKRDETNSYYKKTKTLLPSIFEFIKKAENDDKLRGRNDAGNRWPLYGELESVVERLKNFLLRGADSNEPTWGERFGLLEPDPDKKLPDNHRQHYYQLYQDYYPLYSCFEFHDDMKSYYKELFTVAANTMDEYATYKAERGLIDFTDQEQMLWKLLSESEFVRMDISGFYDILVVDEFQDTSPIQLALFARLNELVKETIWVGDPKQSIFGFRGADMKLMDSVINEIDKKQDGNSGRDLEISWRSRKELVHFSNALFLQPFVQTNNMLPGRVCLNVSSKRSVTPENLGTAVQIWKFDAGNCKLDPDYYNGLAARVKQILCEDWQTVIKDKEEEGETTSITGKDIALLFQRNEECRKMASALISMGIPVCSKSSGLFSQPEAQLLTAVLKVADNSADTLSIAEVMLFETFNGSQEALLNSRLKNVIKAEGNRDVLKSWGLGEDGSNWIKLLTGPDYRFLQRNLSLYDRAVWLTGKLGINQLVAGWPNPGQRTANIEQYLTFLKQYEDQCTSIGEMADIHGFIRNAKWLADEEKDSLGTYTNEKTVTVSTYHAAKGLEWPLVIISEYSFLYNPGKHFFGVRVVAAADFDAKEPLKGRRISLLMKPFISSKNLNRERTLAELQAVWEAPRGQGVAAKADDKAKGQLYENIGAYKEYIKLVNQEDLRKFYVAFTRARDYVILPYSSYGQYKFWKRLEIALSAPVGGAMTTEWGEQLNPGSCPTGLTDTFAGKEISIPAEVISYNPVNEPVFEENHQYETPLLFATPPGKGSFKPAFVSPSLMEKELTGIPAEVVHRFPISLKTLKKPGDDIITEFGNCLHGFFAAATHVPAVKYLEIAKRVIGNHGFNDYIDAANLAEYASEFFAWLRSGNPLRVDAELPIHYFSDEGQLFSGNIDLLITNSEGSVIIDHKTFNPGESTKDEMLARLVGDRFSVQLTTYKEMLTASGMNVVDLCIHLPLRGMIFRIK